MVFCKVRAWLKMSNSQKISLNLLDCTPEMEVIIIIDFSEN